MGSGNEVVGFNLMYVFRSNLRTCIDVCRGAWAHHALVGPTQAPVCRHGKSTAWEETQAEYSNVYTILDKHNIVYTHLSQVFFMSTYMYTGDKHC